MGGASSCQPGQGVYQPAWFGPLLANGDRSRRAHDRAGRAAVQPAPSRLRRQQLACAFRAMPTHFTTANSGPSAAAKATSPATAKTNSARSPRYAFTA